MQRKIPMAGVRVGMYVVSHGEGTFGSPLVVVERILASAEELAELRAGGARLVEIDDEKGAPAGDGALACDLAAERGGALVPKVPLSAELPRTLQHYTTAVRFARKVYESIRAGGGVDMKAAEGCVDDLMGSVVRNRSAAICLTKLADLDDYTFAHNVNVCLFGMIYGLAQDFDAEQVRRIGLAGLLLDLGKARMPLEILNKRGKLTPQELKTAQLHPVEGYRLVRNLPGVHEDVCRAVLEHHERYLGQGYPRGLSGRDICELANVLSVIDVYDALTSDRPYARAKTPSEAFRIMYASRGKDFEPLTVERFIKALGVYPVGSFVRLSNGKFAIVCETSSDRPLKPTVRVVFDSRMRPRLAEVMDLAGAKGGQCEEVEIAECVNPRDYKVDVLRLLV